MQCRIGHLQILGRHDAKSIGQVGLWILSFGCKIQPQSRGSDGEQSRLFVADAEFGGTRTYLMSGFTLDVHAVVAEMDGTLSALTDAGGNAHASLVELGDAGAASLPPLAPCLGTVVSIERIVVEISLRSGRSIGHFRR